MSDAELRLLGDKLEKEQAYWREKLAAPPAAACLPPDFGGRENRGAHRAVSDFGFDADTQAMLFAVCGSSELLVFSALVAALKICLHKYTGAEDIVVGTTIHQRYAELTPLNGLLALRDRVSPAMTAKQVLLEVKKTLAEAYANQKYPFESLPNLLGLKAAGNAPPLFGVAAVFENINSREHLRRLKSDVTFVFQREGDSLSGAIEYDPALYTAAAVELFGEHFRRLLHATLTTPDVEVAHLELLSPEGKRGLLFEFNRTERDYPSRQSVPHLFEEQAGRTPDAAACILGAHELTYRELNARANQLAHYLRREGVGRGVRVGIYLEHSFETLAALLAVLKAGGAYVPLDPDHPRARLAFTIGDAAIPLILTEQRLLENLPRGENVRALCLDADWGLVADESAAPPPCEVRAEDTAYVIYTSGSTGQPKGVKITHRALINYIEWAKEVYLDAGTCAMPLYSSLAFDLTVTSIYTPLLSGNPVVIYRKGADRFALLEVLKDNRVDILKLTPSHLALIRESDNRAIRIRRLIVGGEALSAKLARQLHESFGGRVEIFNEYGPTEATVGCMIYRFDAERDRRDYVPIGRPAANTQIYILDGDLNPVAENVVGELYIAGDGLAEGYLNRDDLTAQRFVANPFVPGRRMYRSGDLARMLPEREIEYLGRGDEQVKYHGHRVELGEVRAALNRHPDVRDSVVVLRRDRNGHDVLVAYYVSRREPEPEALRSFLAESLIEETIPSIFVHLKKLPLTLNGKVNLEALPSVEEARAKFERKYVAPATPVESALAVIWSEVLGTELVGTTDNFFALGGHSLLATQVLSRVREVLRVEIPLRSLFETPTVKALSERIEGLMKGGGHIESPPLRRASREHPLPLSFAQRRLWFIDQLEPGSAFYNVPLAVRLTGRLDAQALGRTLTEVVRRHEVLRTTFANVDGEPVQVIHPPAPVRLEVEDLSGVEGQAREAEAMRLAAAEARLPFDLSTGPLLRARLLRLDEEEHVCLLTLHHIVSDGWSMGVLVREVAALYEAYSRGEGSPLAELAIQYADFAVWQREWLRGEVLERQLNYWRGQLAGAPPVLELPTDKPRPAVQTYEGMSEPLTLSPELLKQLKVMSQREGVTLFMTLLAAFQVLLSRYSGSERVVVGTPIANRNRGETEPLIGFFVNTLALHTDLSGNPSVRELLRRVREVCLGAYTHQDVPFEKLVEELEPERNLSHTPLFQVMFALQNAPAEALKLSGLKFDPLPSENGTAKFDITFLTQEDGGGGLCGAIEYNTDLFGADRIRRMAEHFRSLLEGMAADPSQPLASLKLLSPAELRQTLVEWNATTADVPEVGLPALFESQAERTPGEIAAVYEGQRLSYAELNARANQLAHHLRELGVGPDVPVGILVGRSLEMAVGMLGILKAGGAYVPLDPAHPAERLSFMLKDASARVLLTERALLDRCSPADLPVVCLDADWDKLAVQPETNPTACVLPDNLAYVIYTSGSTGRPKGIGLSHRALVNLIQWHFTVLSRGGRVLQFASLGFDASFHEMFAAWASGGTLYIASEELRLDVAALGAYLSSERIEKAVLPVVVLQQLAEIYGSRPHIFGSLREVITTGEQLQITKPVRELFDRLPDCALHNHYGPSESHVVTSFALGRVPEQWQIHPPIGRPISNTEIYLLDRQLNPVPVGVLGELYIGGVALARSYFNRPGLTAEKFIPNPFGARPGARLYRTGDLARYTPDGEIEYFGRIDHQVKVRGFRVELGEIEAVLGRHPSVREAVSLAREDAPGDKRIVAYVVAEPDAAVTARELRQYLRGKLPEYMVPSAFVLLESFQLTHNGKIDRRALPPPGGGDSESNLFAAPRDLLELRLARIWEEILRVAPVGVRDNFFELGGHSMLAVRLMSRIQQALGVALPLATLFQQATIEHQAGLLRKRAGEGAHGFESSLVEIQAGGPRTPFFCVHPGGGHVLCYLGLARHLGADQPFYGLQSGGLGRGQSPHADIEQMAAHYLEEVRRVQPRGPYLLGGWSMGGLVAFEMARQLQESGEKVALLSIFDSAPPEKDARASAEVDELSLMINFARDLGLSWENSTGSLDELLGLEPGAQLAYVLESGRFSHVLPPDLDACELRRLYEVFKQNVRAMQSYATSARLEQMTLFKASEKSAAPPEHWRAGWQDFITGDLDVQVVPGDHFNMLREPHVKALAERLKSCLDAVCEQSQMLT
jgi:amino acid adenylation domain-containing protein